MVGMALSPAFQMKIFPEVEYLTSQGHELLLNYLNYSFGKSGVMTATMLRLRIKKD